MHSHSFLHPDYAYNISDTHTKAPDIFVVPPEEDQIPPWCCYNSQQSWSAEDEEENNLIYSQASTNTPLFYRDVAGMEGLILPIRKGSAETRSIVDALGDADDFLDHEYDPYRRMEMDSMVDDAIFPEMDTDSGYARHHQHYSQEYGVQLSRTQVDNDSDIVEIIKVRKKSTFIDGPENHPWSSSDRLASKLTLRSRATRAFQILKENLQTSSKTVFKAKGLDGSLSHSSPRLQSKLQSRPRAQDVFSPTEDQPDCSYTSKVGRRPSGRLFSSALKRRTSTSFNTSNHSLPTPVLQTQESQISSQQKPSSRLSDGSCTPSRCSSSSIKNEASSTKDDTTLLIQLGDDGSTPSLQTQNAIYQDQPRSISPASSSRTEIPLSGNRAKRGFSALNLRKIFQKSPPQPPPDVPRSTHQTFGSCPTCPSLSSTPTSESGRTSPTTDSVPQTPTSFDEIETRRIIAPLQSSNTAASGLSLGSSLQSGSVSYQSFSSVSSGATAATPGHCVEKYISSGTRSIHHSSLTNNSTSELSRPSMTSSHSAISINTADGRKTKASDQKSAVSSPAEAFSDFPFDMSLHLELDLNLGLGINMIPSPSGGMLSANGMDKATVPENMLRKVRGRASVSRSLSLKNLRNKLGIRKQDDSPAPQLPKRISDDPDFEMRLDSLHFDDMSFDANNFITR